MFPGNDWIQSLPLLHHCCTDCWELSYYTEEHSHQLPTATSAGMKVSESDGNVKGWRNVFNIASQFLSHKVSKLCPQIIQAEFIVLIAAVLLSCKQSSLQTFCSVQCSIRQTTEPNVNALLAHFSSLLGGDRVKFALCFTLSEKCCLQVAFLPISLK